MAKKATIRNLQIGEMKIELNDTGDKGLKEVCGDIGIRFEGTTFIVNGDRLSEAEAKDYRVKENDTVKANTKGDGGYEG